MPIGPIIDTHFHLWDPRLLRYPWLDSIAALNRPYLLQEYCDAAASVPLEGMIFIQCETEPTAFEREAQWVSELSKKEPRLRGLVAWAPLEKGGAVRAELERLKRYNMLRGIRRIIQFEPDLDFCLRPTFIEGIRALTEFDLSFDICVDYRHLGNIIRLAERVPDVQFILDHIGKPLIKEGTVVPSWANQIRVLSTFPNVSCKISGVATEADHRNWTPELLSPYINSAIDAFGFDRVMFGSDWPVSTQAIRYDQWIGVLDEILNGVAASSTRKFWYENAIRLYRLDRSS